MADRINPRSEYINCATCGKIFRQGKKYRRICNKCHALKRDENRRKNKEAQAAKRAIKPRAPKLSRIENRLMKLVRGRFSNVVQGLRVRTEIRNIVKCDEETFKQWIESQWSEGMTWENYGVMWTIQHEVPEKEYTWNLMFNPETNFDYKNFVPAVIAQT